MYDFCEFTVNRSTVKSHIKDLFKFVRSLGGLIKGSLYPEKLIRSIAGAGVAERAVQKVCVCVGGGGGGGGWG